MKVVRAHIDGSGRIVSAAARDDVKAALLAMRGKDVEIVIRPPRNRRSIDQNAYWWAVPVKLMAEHCGYSPAQMHYALLGECFGYVVGPTGKDVPNVASSSKLTVDEFTRLIEWVLVWGPSEMGVAIPAPHECDYEAD